MRAGVISIVTFYLWVSGCSLMMVGPSVRELNLDSQDNAQENLKAIRAMLADQHSRLPATRTPDVSPPSAPSESKNSDGPSMLNELPSSPSSLPAAPPPAKLPWTPPSISRPAPPDRSVPAYTVPAPVGPDYSGSIRCAPDGMGGQRCAAR